MEDRLKEICKNCGLTLGAHCGGQYHSNQYKMIIPSNCCPGHQGRMDWDKGPGTTFEPTGLFEEVAYRTPAKGGKGMNERPKREGVMLCNPATEARVMKLGGSMFAQPKLNGERCRVEWFHDWPILLSSYGNEFKFLNHIIEAIHEHFKYDQKPLDGELYVHGWSFERIHSAASRKVNENPDAAGLEFHIFDYQSPGSQWQRINTLVVKKGIGSFEKPLIYVPYTIVTSENWMEQAYKYTEEGYEGIILRGAIWEYEKKRSAHMLKFKPTEEDEYTIVGVTEAVSQAGYSKGMIGSFSVCGDDGTAFDVGAGKLLHSERTILWRDRADLIGKKLKVKHEKIKTVNGIPRCAVAVEVVE